MSSPITEFFCSLITRMNYLFLWLSDGANIGTMQQAASIVSQLTTAAEGPFKLTDRSPLVSAGEKPLVPCKLKPPDALR